MKISFLLIFVILFIIGCSFNDLLPPGSVPGNITDGVQVPTYQPGVLVNPSASPLPDVKFFIRGNWRCHIDPSILSDTIIFLHDGEAIELIYTDYDWLLVQAGKYQCYVKREAILK